MFTETSTITFDLFYIIYLNVCLHIINNIFKNVKFSNQITILWLNTSKIKFIVLNLLKKNNSIKYVFYSYY